MKRFLIIFLLMFLFIANVGFSADVDSLIVILKSDAEHKEKWQARADIVKIGADTVELLIDLVGERHDKGTYYAIRALEEIRDERAVDALGEILLDKKYGPRRYAAIALGKIGSERAVPFLVESLSDVNYVQEDALRALKWIGTSEAKEATRKFWTEQGLDPNGLKIGFIQGGRADGTIGPGDLLEFQVLFENIGDEVFSLYLTGIYKASFLIVEADGAAGSWERIVEYTYMESEKDFPIFNPKEQILWKFSGMAKKNAIEFDDLKFSITPESGSIIKFFVVYSLSEDDDERAKALGGRDNLWHGKVVSEPVTLTWR